MKRYQFQPWVSWLRRCESQHCDRPGVYILARFDSPPSGIVDPTVAEIIYIGETCKNSLGGRWLAFNRSAFEQKDGHSGGRTFAAKYCHNRVVQPPPWLHIAALPVELDEPHASAFIRYAERHLIWEYVQRHGAMPPCNKK